MSINKSSKQHSEWIQILRHSIWFGGRTTVLIHLLKSVHRVRFILWLFTTLSRACSFHVTWSSALLGAHSDTKPNTVPLFLWVASEDAFISNLTDSSQGTRLLSPSTSQIEWALTLNNGCLKSYTHLWQTRTSVSGICLLIPSDVALIVDRTWVATFVS